MPLDVRGATLRAISVAFLLSAMGGCSLYRNASPAECFRPNVYDAPRSRQEPVDFTRLRQTPPKVYILGADDVLGIYVEGVLGEADSTPPVHFSDNENIPPSIGFPVPIREDGTLSLPLVPPLHVAGLSLAQAEELIRRAYTVEQQILAPGRDRIIVTLLKRRTIEVVVVREDTTTTGISVGAGQYLGTSQRGAVYTVQLPAYENDVLHALAESGGLPGLDAENAIVILRGCAGGRGVYGPISSQQPNPAGRSLTDLTQLLERATAAAPPVSDEAGVQRIAAATEPAAGVQPELLATSAQIPVPPAAIQPQASVVGPIAPPEVAPGSDPFLAEPMVLDGVPGSPCPALRIPMRSLNGLLPPDLREEDVILHEGDIVFIESRDAEVFYTGGLLPAGQHRIPRDYDLDLLQAMSMAGGSVVPTLGANQGVSGGLLNGSGGGGRGGIFPPSRVLVIRNISGRQYIIKTKVKDLIADPRERILIQPNDMIILEYTGSEMVLNTVLNMLQINYFLNDLR